MQLKSTLIYLMHKRVEHKRLSYPQTPSPSPQSFVPKTVSRICSCDVTHWICGKFAYWWDQFESPLIDENQGWEMWSQNSISGVARVSFKSFWYWSPSSAVETRYRQGFIWLGRELDKDVSSMACARDQYAFFHTLKNGMDDTVTDAHWVMIIERCWHQDLYLPSTPPPKHPSIQAIKKSLDCCTNTTLDTQHQSNLNIAALKYA